MVLDAIVNAINVGKVYRVGEVEVSALKNVSISIARGEFVAVFGPSGSGKTTLLNVIGGLDRPTSGEIYVDGEDIVRFGERKLSRFRARKVGFIFQFFNLIPTFTALENVMVPAEIVGLKPKDARIRAERILARVGLEKRFNHFPHQLSGGEQQRVAIARALINNPPLLLCDEPTGNLDSKTGVEIIELLSEINRERKTTLIIVTHDERIAKAADRIVNLVDGEIIKDDAALP
jgi:putative ABC transport system ATP-binding protein